MQMMISGQCESMSIRRTVNAEMWLVILVLHDFLANLSIVKGKQQSPAIGKENLHCVVP